MNEKTKLVHIINETFKKHQDFIKGSTPLTPQEAYPTQAEPMFNPQDMYEALLEFQNVIKFKREKGMIYDDSAEALFTFLYARKKPEKK